jgi:hypothetical protein
LEVPQVRGVAIIELLDVSQVRYVATLVTIR